MRTFAYSLVCLAAVFAPISTAQAAWICSAPGMISGSYDGGDSAYIHLTGFPSGGSYPVKKSGKSASGTTKNGTRFVCVQK